MKSIYVRLAMLIFVSACWVDVSKQKGMVEAEPPSRKIDWVDTRDASGGLWWASGHTSPAVSRPWGWARLGPDTAQLGKITSSSGYHFTDSELLGFSHTRFSGTGAYEGGALRVRPLVGTYDFNKARKKKFFFSHKDEIAGPGKYSVKLKNIPVNVELTATKFAGLHRYTLREGGNFSLWLRLDSHLWGKGQVWGVNAQKLGANIFQASLILKDAFSSRIEGGLPHYFYGRLEPDPVEMRIWQKPGDVLLDLSEEPLIQSNEVQANETWLELAWGELPQGQQVELQVGMSQLDFAGAVNNLNAEVGVTSFDDLEEAAEMEWEALLGRIDVETDSRLNKKKFYSNLYRSFLMPTCQTEADGRYKDFAGAIQNQGSTCFFSDLSLWDTFRSLHPLYQLIAPSTQREVDNSLIEISQKTGRLPRWTHAHAHVDSMMGFPSAQVLTESFLKNPAGFDSDAAFTEILRSFGAEYLGHGQLGTKGRECMDQFHVLGFCPTPVSHAVSLTLEYSAIHQAGAIFAGELLKNPATMAPSFSVSQLETHQKFFLNFTDGALKLWDTEKRAFVPKDSTLTPIRDISLVDSDYLKLHESSEYVREGSLNQWRFNPGHLGPKLISVWGDSFVRDLIEFFEKSPSTTGAVFPGSYFWQGNEPSLFAPFLFSMAGRSDLSSLWARWVLENKYSIGALALDGDDDAGTLSAYFVLSSLGFFPMAGTSLYFVGSPLFESARLDMGSGRTLSVRAPGASTGKIYVGGVSVNGTQLQGPFFDHSQIANGGEIVFEMSESPVVWGQAWGGF